jgi:hypothetical protein
LAKYGFREATHDFDAIIIADSAMKEAINTKERRSQILAET